MSGDHPAPLPSSKAHALLAHLPWFILTVALSVTWFAWDHERQNTQKALRSQFDFALRETVSRIEQRVHGYEQMLRGVQSLFATTHWQNRQAIQGYVESLQLDADFSGTQNIGVVQWVPAQRVPEHLASMRTAGFEDYAIAPVGQREAYAPIVQREPNLGRNFAPLGTDIWVDPMLRLVAEKARDSGMPAMSGKLQWLAEKGGDAAIGFAMCLPVYAPGQPHDSMAQRRAHLLGWVYATFRMNDFMASLYGSQLPGLQLAIHDGTDNQDSALLYRTESTAQTGEVAHHAIISANEFMVVAGHNWTVSLNTQADFEARYGRGSETTTALAGVFLSLLLTLLAWHMLNGRNRALRLASSMTEELRHMAQHDTLTDLPNRALFNDRLNQELARAKRQRGRFAMLFIDLDHFKPINDKFGHEVGDLVLQIIAKRLSDSVRAADTVGRIGGDEFVVLMAQLSATDFVLHLAEKLHKALRQPISLNGHELSISSCIGVAVYPADGTDAVSLTRSADEAMYRAKAAGRDGISLCEPVT
jgi:diguanylate cyclase (GGDEF)-like protein